MLERSEWIGLARAGAVDATNWASAQRGDASVEAVAALRATLAPHLPVADHEDLSILTPADPAWPEALRHLPDPPAALWYSGDPALLAAPQLAIVGARRASRRAVADAAWLSGALADAGLVITSGLALGVDAAAHDAALQAGGGTIAVLGCGIDRDYPARNRALAARIRAAGLVVSEFPPGTSPLAHHFPRRNRIISGLSLGVLVVEASERSGSMITARLAGAQGREVFAVPSVPRDPGAGGCLRLLREGAVLVRSAQDVLDELPSFDPRNGCEASDAASFGAVSSARRTTRAEARPVPPAAVPEPLRGLARVLAGDGASFETLLASGCADVGDASSLSRLLTEYEIEGWIARQDDRWLWLGAPDSP